MNPINQPTNPSISQSSFHVGPEESSKKEKPFFDHFFSSTIKSCVRDEPALRCLLFSQVLHSETDFQSTSPDSEKPGETLLAETLKQTQESWLSFPVLIRLA